MTHIADLIEVVCQDVAFLPVSIQSLGTIRQLMATGSGPGDHQQVIVPIVLDDTTSLQQSVVERVLHLNPTLETLLLFLTQITFQLRDLHTTGSAEDIDPVIVVEEQRRVMVETFEMGMQLPTLGRVIGRIDPRTRNTIRHK